MNMMNRLRLVLLVLPLVYSIFTPNAFPEPYTRWGLPTGAKARLGKGKIHDIKYFPEGDKIAVATTVGTWIYDVETGREINLLPAYATYIRSVAFSSDGKMFATGDNDGRIELWDTHTVENRATLVGHDDDVRSVAFSPKGGVLASGSHDGTIQLWDIPTVNSNTPRAMAAACTAWHILQMVKLLRVVRGIGH